MRAQVAAVPGHDACDCRTRGRGVLCCGGRDDGVAVDQRRYRHDRCRHRDDRLDRADDDADHDSSDDDRRAASASAAPAATSPTSGQDNAHSNDADDHLSDDDGRYHVDDDRDDATSQQAQAQDPPCGCHYSDDRLPALGDRRLRPRRGADRLGARGFRLDTLAPARRVASGTIAR
jgi:hypothetical protein